MIDLMKESSPQKEKYLKEGMGMDLFRSTDIFQILNIDSVIQIVSIGKLSGCHKRSFFSVLFIHCITFL
jgi:hypothetical protein